MRDFREKLLQIKGLLQGEEDLIANISNVMGALKELPGYFWVGVYRVVGDELVLGPFQGPVACTRIAYGKGVCGSSWKQKESILVADVHEFPGHIACNANSKSEVVVPVFNKFGEVEMVIDVDSDQLNHFGSEDVSFLETVAAMLSEKLLPVL